LFAPGGGCEGVAGVAGRGQIVTSSAGGTMRGLSCACGIAVPPTSIPMTSSQSAAVIRAQTGYGRVSALAGGAPIGVAVAAGRGRGDA